MYYPSTELGRARTHVRCLTHQHVQLRSPVHFLANLTCALLYVFVLPVGVLARYKIWLMPHVRLLCSEMYALTVPSRDNLKTSLVDADARLKDLGVKLGCREYQKKSFI